MTARTDKTTLKLLLAVALIAVLMQVCLMTGCSTMAFAPFQSACDQGGATFSALCTMVQDPAATPAVVVYSGLALLLGLLGMVATRSLPLQVAHVGAVIRRSGAPPPAPEDPRGERLRI